MSRTFGEQIRRLRKARHLTMKELGETLGYSVDYIWKVETGRAYPSGKFIQALADFFGVDLLLDVPEDSESRLIADQVVEKLPPERKRPSMSRAGRRETLCSRRLLVVGVGVRVMGPAVAGAQPVGRCVLAPRVPDADTA